MSMSKYFQTRNFFTSRMISEPKRVNPWGESHKKGGAKRWRFLSLFVVIPTVILMSVKVLGDHKAEHECHKRPKFVPYDHMYVRTKRFPWGDGNHSLFHNPKVNALPTGYEDEDTEE